MTEFCPKHLRETHSWALFELRVWRQLEVIVHPQRNVFYCLICNEFLLLWLFCYHSVSHFDLGEKFMISPLATSLLRSRTVCWGKGKDCSEAEHDYLQALVPLRTVQRPFQWGGSWQDVVIWGCFTVQLVLMSSIKTQTSYVSFIHIQHQCFKQNCRKEQLMFVPVCICIKSLKKFSRNFTVLFIFFLSTDQFQRFYFFFSAPPP